MNIKNLISKAKKLRQETFLEFMKKNEAHLGGSFSMIEMLLYLYEVILMKNDKFVLSKSHASFPLCLLLRKKGLKTKITTHLEIDEKWYFCTSGSLGHGLPIATGMSFARKKLYKKGKIFVLISDGECQEGTTWEALLIAAKNKLDNLVLIVDYNKIQALTTLEEGLPLNNLNAKFKAFNWNVINISNGHSFKALIKGFKKLKTKNKPNVIIIHTTKGKGIKEFENDPIWHARKITGEDVYIAKKRLGIA